MTERDKPVIAIIDGRRPVFKPELDGDRVRIMAADREDLYLTHECQWRSTLIDHWPTQEAAEEFLISLSPTKDKLDAADEARPFRAGTGMMGATETGQRVTAENAHHLPPGSVVRLDDSDGVLVHLHDDIWYWRDGCAWCYDRLERHVYRLPGTLCHIPALGIPTAPQEAGT